MQMVFMVLPHPTPFKGFSLLQDKDQDPDLGQEGPHTRSPVTPQPPLLQLQGCSFHHSWGPSSFSKTHTFYFGVILQKNRTETREHPTRSPISPAVGTSHAHSAIVSVRDPRRHVTANSTPDFTWMPPAFPFSAPESHQGPSEVTLTGDFSHVPFMTQHVC